MLQSFLQDLRYGVRQLARQPGFTAAAVASLALGIGLNTTLFSVVNGVLLRGSAMADPQRLVEIYTGPNQDFPQLTTSYPDFLELARGVDALSGLAASAYVRAILSTDDRGVMVTGETVSAGYFDVLGVQPALGRGFSADEDRRPAGSPVVVLSHGLWQRRFGGDPSALGQAVTLSGRPYTVVGVAPSAFGGTIPGVPTDFWVPVTTVEHFVFAGVQWTTDRDPGATRLERRGTRWLFVKGRLAPGRTVEDARAQVTTVFARLSADYPDTNEQAITSVVPAGDIRFHPMLDGYVKAASAGLLVAVGLVLLIACANVAGLLLARAAARRRELAIRAAVGAGRGRLVRQLLSESLVLGAAGGGLGLLIAWWAGRALTGAGTDVFPMPISFDFSIDARVLGFATAISLATALLFGLAPAWSSSKPDLLPALRDEASGGPRGRLTPRDALVVGQLALSLVLLVAGALLARGLLVARSTDLGYDARHLSSLSFNLQMNGYSVERAVALRDRLLDAVRALPGVTGASLTSRLPLAPDIMATAVKVPGYHASADDETIVDQVQVGADYFATVGIPIVQGRPFSADEMAGGRLVAIANETMARQFWPDGNALGARLHTSGYDSPPHEIVGIARDHKVRSVGEAPRPYLHLPAGPSRAVGMIVRTGTPADRALPMLREAVWALEPDIVFSEDVPATDVAETTMAPTRIGALVVGSFGALALVLATVGLYGVIAYTVSRRTREIGIRMALGAERGQVLRLVLGQGLRLAAVGLALGLAAAAATGRLLESLLYGLSGTDPVAFAAAAGVLLAIACAATLVPALAAARVDPMRAVRQE